MMMLDHNGLTQNLRYIIYIFKNCHNKFYCITSTNTKYLDTYTNRYILNYKHSIIVLNYSVLNFMLILHAVIVFASIYSILIYLLIVRRTLYNSLPM